MRRLRSAKGPDLCERTFIFGVRITKMVRRLPRDVAGYEIGRQVLRSGTSIGANTEEADAAESTDDFLHKMKIALKEAQETSFETITIQGYLPNDPGLYAFTNGQLIFDRNVLLGSQTMNRYQIETGNGLEIDSVRIVLSE